MSDKEILPCPFCGRKPEIIHHDTKKEATWCEWEIECTHGYQKPTIQGEDGDEWCFDFAYAGDNLETVIEHWNTRYERTCRDLHDELTRSFECSECGYVVGDQPLPRESFAYCPGCGAKVVDE